MSMTIEKVQKITSKGQITLPVLWRNRFKTNQVLLKTKDDLIEIFPVRLELLQSREYTVFDALRDNNGKGLRAVDLLRILRKING